MKNDYEQMWINYGYGFIFLKDDIDYINKDLLREFIRRNTPELIYNKIVSHYEPDSVHDWIRAIVCEDYSESGLSGIVQEVLRERSGINFTSCTNFLGHQYILYQPKYPWEMTETELGLTTERLDEIMTDVLLEFMTEIPTDYFDFHSVMNSLDDTDNEDLD